MMDPAQDRRRILAEAKAVEERAWIILKIDNALSVMLLFATLMLGVLFFTDPYYGPKAQALRTLNMTVVYNSNNTLEVVSGHPEFLNLTATITGKTPILPSETSTFRAWMNFIHARKTFYGLISGALIVIQFRYNEGLIRNKLSRFTTWIGFHAFMLVMLFFAYVGNALYTGIGIELTFGIFAFLAYRVIMIKCVYDLYVLRRRCGMSHLREIPDDIPEDLAFGFGVKVKAKGQGRQIPPGMTYIPAGTFYSGSYNVDFAKNKKPAPRNAS